jgi:hypothetical protein
MSGPGRPSRARMKDMLVAQGRALEMRRAGDSAHLIAANLGVAVTTVARWTKGHASRCPECGQPLIRRRRGE